MLANLENSAVATGLKKVIFHSTPKKGNAKESSNHHTIAIISHASRVMLKILQVRLQHYVNWEILDTQAGFRKGRGTRDQIANHEIKRCFLLGRTATADLDSILKRRNIILPAKVCLVKAMVFPVVMCGCASWNIEKADHQWIDTSFELWC